jgi:pyridoxine/pyridoxamine 5'-phosphate oxidase
MIQYRIRGQFKFESNVSLKNEWEKKDRTSRILDLFHDQKRKQSSLIKDHQTLVTEVKQFEKKIADTAINSALMIKKDQCGNR